MLASLLEHDQGSAPSRTSGSASATIACCRYACGQPPLSASPPFFPCCTAGAVRADQAPAGQPAQLAAAAAGGAGPVPGGLGGRAGGWVGKCCCGRCCCGWRGWACSRWVPAESRLTLFFCAAVCDFSLDEAGAGGGSRQDVARLVPRAAPRPFCDTTARSSPPSCMTAGRRQYKLVTRPSLLLNPLPPGHHHHHARGQPRGQAARHGWVG